jgi:Ca-activated chloride channel family protein
MKQVAVALWTLVGVALSSAAALAVPISHADRPVAELGTEATSLGASAQTDGKWQFSVGRNLVLDARVGHKAMPLQGGETFLYASVASRDESQAVAAPLHLGIVIDRSGSMKGQRITNALAAAMGTVDRMREGDLVSVVSFDDSAQVVVPPTRISQDTRSGIISAIQSIRLGGDTCVSCGLETAMQELARATEDRAITRMLLLSDGAANKGVRDVPGLRELAARMRDRGCTISTIGVDVDFDEKIMSAIALESNGRHYFVANASELPNVFQREFESLLATVARDAELEIELAPGVETVQVFDRTHRRSGQRITLPFGTLSARQEKTVLLKVRVPSSAQSTQPIARLRLVYQDASKFSHEELAGTLAVKASASASLDDLDPFVAARLSRSLTADALTEANALFEQGRVDDARRRLASQAGDLAKIAPAARAKASAAPTPNAATPSVDKDFERQIDAVKKADSTFGASPAPQQREGRTQVRANQATATESRL